MAAPAPIPDDVTVCVTSCARPDLLAQTLASFRKFHTVPKMIVCEDSGDERMRGWLNEHCPEAKILFGSVKTGMMASIDRLYAAVETPFIFHLEDDWRFDGPVDFALAKRVLDADPKVSIVCVRSFTELKARHRARAAALPAGGAGLRVMPADAHPQWYGYTSNPGTLRRAFWERYQPVARTRHDDLSEIAKRDGFRVAYVTPGVAHHIGAGRHVADPFQPRTGKLGWLKKAGRDLRARLSGGR